MERFLPLGMNLRKCCQNMFWTVFRDFVIPREYFLIISCQAQKPVEKSDNQQDFNLLHIQTGSNQNYASERKSTNKGFRRKSLYHLKKPANCQRKIRFRKEFTSSKIEEDISAKFYWIFKYFLKWHKDLSKICIARQKENFCSRITINPFKKSPTAPTFSTLSSVVSAISKKSLNELHSINFWTVTILEAVETTFAKMHFPSGKKNWEQDQQVQSQKMLRLWLSSHQNVKKKSKNHAYFSAFSKRIISNTQEKLPKEFKASFKLPFMQTYSLELEGIFWKPTKNIALLSRLRFSEEKKWL